MRRRRRSPLPLMPLPESSVGALEDLGDLRLPFPLVGMAEAVGAAEGVSVGLALGAGEVVGVSEGEGDGGLEGDMDGELEAF